MHSPLRLGLLGGSFDPVHYGHLGLAEACLNGDRLDEVWFVPTAVQPLKPHGPVASNADRLAMLRLATADRPEMVVSTLETDRGGTSYTVDTLRTIRQLHPEAELFLLVGADTLRDFRAWRDGESVLRLAFPLVVQRAGQPEADFQVLEGLTDTQRIEAIRQAIVPMPPLAISSSRIRRQIASGESPRASVPVAVAQYLKEHRLYENNA